MPPETVTNETFEVAETQVTPEVKTPSRDDLKSQGWSAGELESAEKRGMISKPEEKKVEEKNEVVVEEKKPEVKAEEKIVDRRQPLPDFTFKTPEQEKAFLDAFGPGTPPRAIYFRMKNERSARQVAEQERDKERQLRESLEARNKALEANKAQEVDELGNPIDPEDRPLTVKQLREIQKTEAAEIEKKQKENESRARVVAEAQETQEEYARSIYPDFDDTVKKAAEVIKSLDTMIPEKWQQAKAVNMIRELQRAAANADKIDIDDYHAALIAYEIGKMHPDYGKTADTANPTDLTSEQDGKSKDPKKANGGRLTPEQMKRIEKNTQRGASSASVTGGGGKRVVSAEDVDLSTLNQMTYADRQRFREKHPDQYAKLLRG